MKFFPAVFLWVLISVAAISATAQETAPIKWRSDKSKLDSRDFEFLSKHVVYQAGRARPEHGVKQDVPIMNDEILKKHLAQNDLVLMDAIDDKSGFQAILLKDTRTGDQVVVMRGTELSNETKRDVSAAAQGTLTMKKRLAVGKDQYQSGQVKLHKWIDDAAKQGAHVHATGHSMAGAHTQRLLLDKADKITSARVYNSPGLEASEIERIVGDDELMANLHDAEGKRKLSIFNALNDIVGLVGGPHVPGDVYLASGGTAESSPHNGMIVGSDATIETKSWAMFQMIKGRHGRKLKWEMSFSEMAKLTGIDFVTSMVNYHFTDDHDDIIALISEIQRDEVQFKREHAHPHLKSERLLAEAMEDAILSQELIEEALLNELNIQATIDETALNFLPGTGMNAPDGSASAPEPGRGPVKGGTLNLNSDRHTNPGGSGDIEKAIQEEQIQPVGIFGDFEGTMSGSGEHAYLTDGKLSFSIEDTKITGQITARVQSRSNAKSFDSVAGRITGHFNPSKGTLTAEIRFKAGTFSDMQTKVNGSGGLDGFSGNWDAPFLSGTWEAHPKTVRAVTWEEAICAKYPYQPEVWRQLAVTCPPKK